MRNLWAIARNTLLMILRRRAAFAAVMLIAVFSPMGALYLESDGTVVGKLQMVLTYNFLIMGSLMMAILLYLSATVLDAEFTGKHIFMLDVKPLARWKLLLGKWLGLMIAVTLLVVIMGAQTYTVMYIVASTTLKPFGMLVGTWLLIGIALLKALFWSRRVEGGRLLVLYGLVTLWCLAILYGQSLYIRSAQQTLSSHRPPAYEVKLAYEQILVSRKSFRPELPDVEEEVRKYKERLAQEGRLEEGRYTPEQLRLHLRQVVNKKLLPIPYRATRPFRFTGLPTDKSLAGGFTIRHKLYGTRGDQNADYLQIGWTLVNPENGTYIVPRATSTKAGKTREFYIPANIISESGTLNILVTNQTGPKKQGDQVLPPARVNVALDRGIELLVPAGSFGLNFSRALFLFWIRMAFIAAVGICVNTFLSGSISVFFIFGMVLAPGMLNKMVSDVYKPKRRAIVLQAREEMSKQVMDSIRKEYGELLAPVVYALGEAKTAAMSTMLTALPDFEDTDPVTDLVVGREISYGRLLWRLFCDLGLRAGLLALIAVNRLYRKEVALPLVY